MALPTTGLTFHVDASVDTDLWQVDVAGVFATHPTNGQAVNYWDDVEHGALTLVGQTSPVWQSSTPLMALPCVGHNGSSQYSRIYANDGTTGKQLSDLISLTAFTVLLSVYVEAVATNDATIINNDGIMGDNNSYFGIYLKHPSGYTIKCQHYSSAYVEVELPITLNASHVLMYRHESGNIYASLDGGAESSVASGTTGSGTGAVYLGRGYSAHYFNGRIGEVAFYNAALTGSDLTDAITYFTAKWLPSSSGAGRLAESGALVGGGSILHGRIVG